MQLEDILDDLKQSANSGDTSVGGVLDAFSKQSLGVLITLFSTVAALPVIGAIPGVSIGAGALILVAIGQSLFANGGIWAPKRLRDVHIDGDKLSKAVDKSKPLAKWVDRRLSQRLLFLTQSKLAHWSLIGATALLATTYIPLALFPWGVMVPAFATLAFGLALMSKDGLMAVIGYAFTVLTLGVVVWVF